MPTESLMDKGTVPAPMPRLKTEPASAPAPADDWHMEDAPTPPRNGEAAQSDVPHIPNTKGWKPTSDFPKSGHVTSPDGVRYVRVKDAGKAHIIVDAKLGPMYLRREEEPTEPDEAKALAARNAVREKKGRKAAGKPAAAKKPDSPGKGRGHGGRAKGVRLDYGKMTDAEVKKWATERQPWFMTRARQIEMQGTTGFRERVAKLMGVGVPGSRSKSKAKATTAEAPATTTPAPKPASKSTARKEAAKAERKARKR